LSGDTYRFVVQFGQLNVVAKTLVAAVRTSSLVLPGLPGGPLFKAGIRGAARVQAGLAVQPTDESFKKTSTWLPLRQGFGSASISCRAGSGSRILKTDADPDPDTDPDPRPDF